VPVTHDLQPPYDQFASQPTIGRLNRFLHRLCFPRPSAWGPCTPATLAHFTPTTIHNLIRSLRHYHPGNPPPTSATRSEFSLSLNVAASEHSKTGARAQRANPTISTTDRQHRQDRKRSPLPSALHIVVWPASVSRVLPALLRSAPRLKHASRGLRAFDSRITGPASSHHSRLSRLRGRTLRHHVWRRHGRRTGWRE
jgi:hypothetical protein